MGERGGIAIDNFCRTSDPDVYAIGECALWSGKIFGLVAPGYDMARVVAQDLSSPVSPVPSPGFTGADMSTKLKLLGVDVASIGDAQGATVGCLNYLFSDEVAGHYKKLVVSADKKKLLGAVLVGEAEDYGSLLQMALNGIPLPEHPEDLILPAREGGAKAGLGVDLLPPGAMICSCNNVTKAGLCSAIAEGSTSIGALKKCTKAATSCGGCAPLVKQVLDAELKKAGVTVFNHVCEHFAHSRQELFHLIKIGQFKAFDEVLLKHGKGRGCDICKPAVASILASVNNEFVLKPKHASTQDTNDYYLANLQKDGTYSVVPRIPGGEITPEKLIVIGRVAQHYGLYTKITGGQRIDLFGARVEQLPLIWKELVDAGFESGHAYGKSLRTVKSCVGSTWCRFGVQDSVSMAIKVEERYRGMRSPHKLKMAVSGCTRECAEAQSKDVGVIATEKGWNLYVCGNGGMKPRHADLLATDLDDATLVKYIDRFFMFYIRTGDRLQRTSTWLENLEGGIDYVKKVVCEDSLGIGAELEAEMQKLVDTYECEWKKAINTPETLKRFRHFVNSSESDTNIQFVDERGQIRPMTRREKQVESVG
jgi:nitrite reductase (NADH) large subunit